VINTTETMPEDLGKIKRAINKERRV